MKICVSLCLTGCYTIWLKDVATLRLSIWCKYHFKIQTYKLKTSQKYHIFSQFSDLVPIRCHSYCIVRVLFFILADDPLLNWFVTKLLPPPFPFPKCHLKCPCMYVRFSYLCKHRDTIIFVNMMFNIFMFLHWNIFFKNGCFFPPPPQMKFIATAHCFCRAAFIDDYAPISTPMLL